MSTEEGIYSRGKKRLDTDKRMLDPKIEEQLELLKDRRKELEAFIVQIDAAMPKLKAIEESAILSKAMQTDPSSLDKIERDTLLMFQTYLKNQGITPP